MKTRVGNWEIRSYWNGVELFHWHHKNKSGKPWFVFARGSSLDNRGGIVKCDKCSELAPSEVVSVFKLLPLRGMRG